MTTIAPPLDTKGGAFYVYGGPKSRGVERGERGVQPIGDGGTGSWTGRTCVRCAGRLTALRYSREPVCVENVYPAIRPKNPSTVVPIDAKIAGRDRKTR